MLNTCLTVRAHEPASHKDKGWERFTQKVVDTVAKTRTRGVVFLAWGSQAQLRCKGLGTSGKHLVLESTHPSPFSAHKGFLTCGHFKKTNEWLKGRYGTGGVVDWNLDQPKPIAAARVKGSVQATADQAKGADEAGPTIQLAEEQQDATATESVVVGRENGQSPEEDDTDAIDALQEMAQAELEAEKRG